MEPLITLGVVADTHVPDRVNALHPALIESLRVQGVQRILHAGDVCVPAVLDELEQVAPVSAARGNRDWMFTPALPWAVEMELGGARLALVHGQGSFLRYWWDKVLYVLQGYRFERYRNVVLRACPHADVIIYGHTHQAENRREGGRLFFNPGSASLGIIPGRVPPSFGVLRVYTGGRVEGEIHVLKGWKVQRGRWVREIG
ncbi:metallophosphoesterase family protein [Anaerolinea sp.]|uniref:metallophosphoesterase family protein n=1 Tax=Anaerolinea sp. TaxID=1872519 RepID=UPI002ACEB807|nr:metallophosphoesterase family protein [Anaerolinea sp.]